MIIYDINLDHRADRREQISNRFVYRPTVGLQRRCIVYDVVLNNS